MRRKRLALLVTGTSPQAAYAPLMMAATAAAMDYDCKLFFAFGGLELLRSEPSLALPEGMPGTLPEWASLRAACVEQGVEFIACSASLDMLGIALDQLIPGVSLAGMATWMGFASGAEIQLNFS
ncbi:MAG: DsrE/DsrF/DrsH-like family protein [Pseudomonadota bacterium]